VIVGGAGAWAAKAPRTVVLKVTVTGSGTASGDAGALLLSGRSSIAGVSGPSVRFALG